MGQPPQGDAALLADVSVRRQAVERRHVMCRQRQWTDALGLGAEQIVHRLGRIEQHIDRSRIGGNDQHRAVHGPLQHHGEDRLRGQVGSADREACGLASANRLYRLKKRGQAGKLVEEFA